MSEPPASADPPDRRRRRLLLAVVAGVLVVLVGAGYAGVRRSGPDQTSRSSTGSGASATPTPLASLDLSGLPVARRSLCDRISRDDVESALRGPVTETDDYASGDRASLTATVRDVSHEYDCTYRSDSGAEARVWVFAGPVTRPAARGIVHDTAARHGCRPVRGGPQFGSPDVSTRCRVDTPAGTAVSLRGLFGDAWLSCELSTPDAATGGDPVRETVRRSQRWCVAVATSVGAR